MAEALVLIAGMSADARVFWHQLVAFSASRPVLVVAPTGGATVEEMAAGLIENLPPRCAVAGMGLGGNVALELLRKAPDRISRIALMALSVQSDTPQMAAAREDRIIGAQVGKLAEMVALDWPETVLAEGAPRAEIRQLVHDMALTLGDEVYIRQSRAMQRRPDQQKALRKAMLPALVICGSEDPITPPRRHEFVAEMLPYGQLQVIEGAGHLPPLEKPAAVTRALRAWLDAPLALR